VERLGSIKTFRVDIRVIAATNKDLKKLVRKGHFREDLFYRLAVVEINIPPLRHRLDDIRPLVEHFIPRLNQRTGAAVVEVDATVLEAFETYHWPGNVRQLINVLEAAMHFAAGSVIEYKDLPPSFRKELELHRQRRPVPLESSVALGPVQDIEKELIKRALTKSGGNKRRAALELGIARSTLYSKLRRYGLR
jgi:transcriptional regulator with PAS, ATPase and Fis domain